MLCFHDQIISLTVAVGCNTMMWLPTLFCILAVQLHDVQGDFLRFSFPCISNPDC